MSPGHRADDALAAAVRRGDDRRVPGPGRYRGPGGLGARRGARRGPAAGAGRAADPEPRRLRRLPEGRGAPGPGHRRTRRRSGARSATTSRRWRSTPPSRGLGPAVPGARPTTTTWSPTPETARPPGRRGAGRRAGPGPARGPPRAGRLLPDRRVDDARPLAAARRGSARAGQRRPAHRGGAGRAGSRPLGRGGRSTSSGRRRWTPARPTTAGAWRTACSGCGGYPEALAAADRGLALAPANLDLIEDKAMVHLAQGDLAGARAVLRAARGSGRARRRWSPSSATTGTSTGCSTTSSSSCCCG